MLKCNKYKHKINKNFLKKVESKLYENFNVSKIVRLWVHSNSSYSNEGGIVKMRVKNMNKKLADFQISYMKDLALEKNK